MSSEKRAECHRRKLVALLAGGRVPSEATWSAVLDDANAVAERRNKRMAQHLDAEPAQSLFSDEKVAVLLRPDHVAVHADVVLGIEVELNDLREMRENVEQHRMELLELIRGARIPPGCGDPDLFALERALETGTGLPRDANAQVLAVVRELIRWRGAAKQGGG